MSAETSSVSWQSTPPKLMNIIVMNTSVILVPSTPCNNEHNSTFETEAYGYDFRHYHIVEFVTFPFIFILGSVCNTLIFLVMRRKRMRQQSTYFYMAVLAIADEMVLINGCLQFWLFLYTGQVITIMSNVLCKLNTLTFYASLHFSVWMVVIMTIERFVAVALPLQASRLCTVEKAKKASLMLTVVVLLVNSHFLFTHSLMQREMTSLGCEPSNQIFDHFMKHAWPWIDATIYSFVPLSLLVFFNTLIVYNLIKASEKVEHMQNKRAIVHFWSKQDAKQDESPRASIRLNEIRRQRSSAACYSSVSSSRLDSVNSKDSSKRHYSSTYRTMTSKESTRSIQTSPTAAANRRLAIMLLVVSVTFFLTSVPIVTLQMIEYANLVASTVAVFRVRGVFLSLQYLNHSINFFLYAVTGKTFRKEFFALFKRRWLRTRDASAKRVYNPIFSAPNSKNKHSFSTPQ